MTAFLNQQLASIDQLYEESPYPLKSRIHTLNQSTIQGGKVWVKRDDELGFGISGSKIRKYASLIPFLIAQNIEEVIILGSVNSNNVLGLSQLLIENNIRPYLLLRGEPPPRSTLGPFTLTRLLVPDMQMKFVSRKAWANVKSIASTCMEQRLRQGINAFLLGEGASIPESLPGSLTLGIDILRNEVSENVKFQNIFIDSGSGLTSLALILLFSYLNKPVTIHVLLLANDESVYLKKLEYFKNCFEDLVGIEVKVPTNFCLYRSVLDVSSNKASIRLKSVIKQLAQEEGIITEPMYSARLFEVSKRIISDKDISGNALIIHSGGGLGIFGCKDYLVLPK